MAKPNILSKRQLALLIGGLAVGAHLPTAWAAADVPKQSGGLRNWLDTELRSSAASRIWTRRTGWWRPIGSKRQGSSSP